MPPQKKDKKKHNRGKQFSTFEDVARREGTWKAHRKDRNFSSSSDEDDEEDDKSPVVKADNDKKDTEGDDTQADKPVRLEDSKPAKKKADDEDDLFDCQPLNRGLNDDNSYFSGGPTRKQKEELEKERKRRAYEKLHKEGKTDESKKDMERLAEIRKRREAAKAEKEAAAAEAEKKKASQLNNSDYMAALGGEKSRKMPGTKKERGKDECGDMYEAYRTEKKVEEVDRTNVKAGTIEACRIEEEDFM